MAHLPTRYQPLTESTAKEPLFARAAGDPRRRDQGTNQVSLRSNLRLPDTSDGALYRLRRSDAAIAISCLGGIVSASVFETQ
jgi:hypothetical protein